MPGHPIAAGNSQYVKPYNGPRWPRDANRRLRLVTYLLTSGPRTPAEEILLNNWRAREALVREEHEMPRATSYPTTYAYALAMDEAMRLLEATPVRQSPSKARSTLPVIFTPESGHPLHSPEVSAAVLRALKSGRRRRNHCQHCNEPLELHCFAARETPTGRVTPGRKLCKRCALGLPEADIARLSEQEYKNGRMPIPPGWNPNGD